MGQKWSSWITRCSAIATSRCLGSWGEHPPGYDGISQDAGVRCFAYGWILVVDVTPGTLVFFIAFDSLVHTRLLIWREAQIRWRMDLCIAWARGR